MITVQWKRFDSRGNKLFATMKQAFQIYLQNPDTDLITFPPERYNLVANLCHIGKTPQSGHYVTIVKHDGVWKLCNDYSISILGGEDRVSEVIEKLKIQTYMCIYEKEGK